VSDAVLERPVGDAVSVPIWEANGFPYKLYPERSVPRGRVARRRGSSSVIPS